MNEPGMGFDLSPTHLHNKCHSCVHQCKPRWQHLYLIRHLFLALRVQHEVSLEVNSPCPTQSEHFPIPLMIVTCAWVAKRWSHRVQIQLDVRQHRWRHYRSRKAAYGVRKRVYREQQVQKRAEGSRIGTVDGDVLFQKTNPNVDQIWIWHYPSALDFGPHDMIWTFVDGTLLCVLCVPKAKSFTHMRMAALQDVPCIVITFCFVYLFKIWFSMRQNEKIDPKMIVTQEVHSCRFCKYRK